MARPSPTSSQAPRFIILASTCIIVAALYFARDVMIPLALALLLTFMLTPISRRLERMKIGRIPSTLITVCMCFAVVAVLGYVVGQQFYDLANNIDQYKDNIVSKVVSMRIGRGGLYDKLQKTATEFQENLERPEPATTQATQPNDKGAEVIGKELAARAEETRPSRDQVTRSAAVPQRLPTTTKLARGKDGGGGAEPVPVVVIDPPASPFQQLGAYLGLVLPPLGTAGIVIVFLVFMLLEREELRNRLIRLASSGHKELTVATQALDDASSRVSKYLLAQAFVNGTYGVAVSLGLWIIGVTLGRHDPSGTDTFPSFVLWGLLCALLRFIPYIGPWLGASFPLLITLAVYKGFAPFGATIGMFVLIELISNNLMEPWLYGSSTGISTVAILVSAVFWTWLWGPIGLLLSTPLTVVLVVIGKYVPQLAFLDILLGDEPVLEPPERLYQRLLALDQEEATELVRTYRDEMPLEEVYDTVLLQTLSMAEQDRHRGQLDADRQKFIHQAVRDIIDELGEDDRIRAARGEAKQVEDAAKDAASEPVPEVRKTLPQGCVVNIVCLPAHDDADELVNLMLAQLLTLHGFCATSMSVTKLAGEMVSAVQSADAHAVVISALPPSAVAHARYLCKRIHAKAPDIRMIVGLWLYKGDVRKAKDRIACDESVRMTSTLRAAIEELQQFAAPIIAKVAK